MKRIFSIALFAFTCCFQLHALDVRVDTLVPSDQSEKLNNTWKIEAAITQVINAGGGKVIIPTGSYYTYGIGNLNASNITIKGENGAKLLPMNCEGIKIGTHADRKQNVTIENLTIDMTFAQSYTGIHVYSTDETKIINTSVVEGTIGIDLDGSYNVSIIDTKCLRQSSIGLLIGPASDKTFVRRGQYGNGNKGIVIEGGYAITVTGASIERNDSYAIDIIPSTANGRIEYPGAINITGNYIERCCQVSGDAFIRIGLYNSTVSDYAKSINITGNFLNWDIHNPRTNIQPFYKFDKCAYVTITGNRYINSDYYAEKTNNTDWDSVIAVNDPAASGSYSAGVLLNSYQLKP